MNKEQAKKRARQITAELLRGYKATEPEYVSHEIQKLIDRMDPPPETRPICPVCGRAVRLTKKGKLSTHRIPAGVIAPYDTWWTGRCYGSKKTLEEAKGEIEFRAERAEKEADAERYRNAPALARLKAQQEDARQRVDAEYARQDAAKMAKDTTK